MAETYPDVRTRSNALLLKETKRIHMNILAMCVADLYPTWNGHQRSPFSRVYLPYKGSGVLNWADKEITMTPGNIYIVPAGLEFSYHCPDTLSKLFFHISLPRYDRYDMLDGYPDIITLTDCQELTDKLVRCFHQSSTNSAFSIRTGLNDIFERAFEQENIQWGVIEIYSVAIKNTMKYVEQQIDQALHFEMGNLQEKLAAPLLADLVGYTARQLQDEFHRQVKVPLRRYINDQIFFAAENELRTGTLPIGEISRRLDFCDQFHFSRRFHQRYSTSPQYYRKMSNI